MKNSVFGRFSSLPPAPPPQKQEFSFYCRLAVSEFVPKYASHLYRNISWKILVVRSLRTLPQYSYSPHCNGCHLYFENNFLWQARPNAPTRNACKGMEAFPENLLVLEPIRQRRLSFEPPSKSKCTKSRTRKSPAIWHCQNSRRKNGFRLRNSQLKIAIASDIPFHAEILMWHCIVLRLCRRFLLQTAIF